MEQGCDSQMLDKQARGHGNEQKTQNYLLFFDLTSAFQERPCADESGKDGSLKHIGNESFY